MATNSTDLFSFLPGIEVSADELLQGELLAQQILKAKFPDIDLREGTAIRDLVIRPSATLMAMINKALVFYFQQNTLSEVKDDTPQIFVDKMLSNWFLERKIGLKAVINVRLYFAKSKQVSLFTDVGFSTDGIKKFYPEANLAFAANQLTFDVNANQYYLDVDLVAEKAGKDYNIGGGSLLYFTNFDAYFLHGEINYLKSSAEDIETNSEFIARAKSAISTRNLINVPSIDANLMANFPALTGVKSSGFSDPEMVRDKILVYAPGIVDPVWIHNGGCVDIYSRVPLATSIVQVSTDDNGKVILSGAAYKFSRSRVSGGAAADTVPLQLTQAITSITRTSTTATVTTTSNHGYTTGDIITISGCTLAGYNLTAPIVSTGVNTFTYTVDGSLTTPAAGTTKLAGKDLAYTSANFYHQTVSVTSITRLNSTATATMPKHGLMVGERVLIAGAGQAEYNGIKTVTDTPTADTFTFTVSGTPITATGTVTAKYVTRQGDVGFSDRQKVTVDFTNTYANSTVSFELDYFDNLHGIQNYLDGSDNRVLCADLLARGFNLCLLDVVITGYSGVTPNASLANTTIKAYLAGLAPGQAFIMADLLSQLYSAGIQTIKTPLGVTYTKYWRDLLGTTTGTITDVLNTGDSTNLFMLNSVTTTIEIV